MRAPKLLSIGVIVLITALMIFSGCSNDDDNDGPEIVTQGQDQEQVEDENDGPPDEAAANTEIDGTISVSEETSDAGAILATDQEANDTAADEKDGAQNAMTVMPPVEVSSPPADPPLALPGSEADKQCPEGDALSWDITGPDAPNDIHLSCCPPAGFVRLVLTNCLSDDPESIADDNFIIMPSAEGCCGCGETNLADPELTFSRFTEDNKGVYLHVSNLWLVDDCDILSLTGTNPDDDLGIKDRLGNTAGECAMILLNDKLGPAIRSASVDEREYDADPAERDSDHFDLLTLIITEELNAAAGPLGYEIASSRLSQWQVYFGEWDGGLNQYEHGPLTQIPRKTIDGVTYPDYSYNETSGEATLSLIFPDGSFNGVSGWDHLVLGNTPVDDIDKGGNGFFPLFLNSNPSGVKLDSDHSSGEDEFRNWNRLMDTVTPKIGDQTDNGVLDGVGAQVNTGDPVALAQFGLDRSGFSHGQNQDFYIKVTFTEEADVSQVEIDLDWDNENDWEVADIYPTGNAAMQTTELYILFENDGGGLIVNEDDVIEFENITDISGLPLHPNADELEARGAGVDPIIE